MVVVLCHNGGNGGSGAVMEVVMVVVVMCYNGADRGSDAVS